LGRRDDEVQQTAAVVRGTTDVLDHVHTDDKVRQLRIKLTSLDQQVSDLQLKFALRPHHV